MRTGHLSIAPLLALCLLALGTNAQELAFPLKAEDLQAGVRLATGQHGGDIQDRALDIVAMRHLGGDRWTEIKEGGDRNRNEDRVAYGIPFYAMADGEVIGCWRNAPENPGTNQKHPARLAQGGSRIIGGGNHLWIRQDDGQVALYAHAIPGTIPASLCPNSDELTPSAIGAPGGNPDVDRHAFVPPGVPPTTATGPGVIRPRVRRGQKLGLIGNSGSSSKTHLHFHVESGFDSTARPVAMHFERGLWSPRSRSTADINDWRSFSGRVVPDREVLIWPPRTVHAEYARHGFTEAAFQRQFDHLANSGYMPEILDCYGVGGRLFFNMVWRPARGNWFAVAGATPQRYQKAFDDAGGFMPVFVDSCSSRSGTRYTAIFRKGTENFVARHNISVAKHRELFDDMVKANLAPVSVSVVSRDGDRRFTVLYRPRNIGSWKLRSRLRRAGGTDQYNEFVNQAVRDSAKAVYVNGYIHNGEEHFVAIVADRPTGPWRARHNRDASTFQKAWDAALADGFRTQSVTAFDGAENAHRFAGIWVQP